MRAVLWSEGHTDLAGIRKNALSTPIPKNQKSLTLSHQALFWPANSLVAHCDVGRLRTLRALFDIELNLLSFLQVPETVALNGREMDKNVLSTFALDKAEALVTIEPLDRTSYAFRHCICLLWQLK
jgi:hypothetical protein